MLLQRNFLLVNQKILSGIIDLLTRKMAIFGGDQGIAVTWHDVPAEYVDQVEDLRNKLVEKACDFDDVLAEKYLNEEEISIPEIKAALRKGTIKTSNCIGILLELLLKIKVFN